MRFVRMAAALLLLALLGVGAAFGHAKMTTSVPEDGATVPAGLSQIEMTFSHPMRLTTVRVRRAADDHDVLLAATLPEDFVDSAKVAVEALSPGTYTVAWTAVSKDGHVMKGSFAFKVAGPDASRQ